MSQFSKAKAISLAPVSPMVGKFTKSKPVQDVMNKKKKPSMSGFMKAFGKK